MTQIIDVQWVAPGTGWRELHWSLISELPRILEQLKPPVVYRLKSGTIWIPVESETK